MNKLKRFGTIYNNMDSVCDNCNKLQNKIKELKDEIKLLNEKNYILNNIIKDNVDPKDNNDKDFLITKQKERIEELIKENKIQDLNIKENINIKNTKEYIELKQENEELQQEIYNKIDTSDEINKLNKTISNLQEQINNIPNEKEIENKYKTLYEELIKEQQKKVKNKVKNESNKVDKSPNIEAFDKAKSLLKRYPITIYRDINDNEVKDMVASECAYLVKYQYEISNKTNNENEISISDIIDYIIVQEKLSSQEKNRLLNKYERCEYLHKTYIDKLNIFKFDLAHISVMTKEEWKTWLEELHKLIKQEYPDDVSDNVIINKCNYIYLKGKTKGQKCNKIECRTKSHKKIH